MECDNQWRKYEIAVYPESIIYPGGRYRVWFERDANRRTDVENFWDNRNIRRQFLRYRLNEIRIQHDSNLDGLFDEIIRKYVLTYESNPSEVIFPGVTWTAGGKTLTLKSIQEFGKNNAALPATTFDYDEMHLTTAENGYGGRVEFQYETEPWHSPSAGVSHGFRDETAKHCTVGGSQETVGPWNRIRGKLECMGYNINIKDEPHTSNVGEAYIKLPKSLIYPGGKYQVFSDYQHTITVGIGNSTQKWYSDNPGPENGNQISQISRYFLLPKNYANQNLWGLVLCEGCLVGGMIGEDVFLKYEVNHLLTRYRVTQKSIKDTLTNETSEFSYSYASEKTNTRAAGATCPAYDTEKTDACYFEQNSQFLGNGKVVETGPNNLVTITRFLQSEGLLGKISSVETRAGSENGTLIQSTHYLYESSEIPTSTDSSFFPHRDEEGLFTDMHIYWARVYSEETRTYDNQGYNYIAVRKQYEYDPNDQNPSNPEGVQYGNVTRVTSYSSMYGYDWKGLNTVRTRYYPTVNNDVYLVGLPAIEGVYGCNGSVCNVGYTSQLSSTWYLYDGNTVYSQPLSTGKLTGLRTLLRYDGADGTNPVFRDERYGYDAWGNRNSVTVYRGEGSASSPAAGTEQTTTTCYGAFGGTPAAPQCVDDTYHTYPGWQMNAAGQLTRWNYDKSLGVPVSETDPNGVITTASYDNFGRLTSIVRPPDTTASPSFSVAYHDTSPYWVELQQKVNDVNITTMQKFYNGLGQLIQIKSDFITFYVKPYPITRDIIVDYIYDDYGRVTHQSMPYAVTPASGYHTPSAPASEYTVTDYDLRGRVVAVTPPNGAGQTISYGMAYQGDLGPTFTIDSSDANGHTTQTLKDAWERVVKVIPEEGSPVSYAYDGLGKLVATTTGVGTVAIQYDLGGRKLSMNDPDMGNWSYTYNALGELTVQTDARGCTSNLAYDALGRVTSKTFSGAGYCGDTPTVAYYYDGQGFTFLGQSYGGGSYTTGRRTAMLDGSGMTTWSYDQRGRVVSETRRIYSDTASTQAEAFTTQWSYNSADLPVTTTYPDGETLAIEYDRQGKPLTMANTNAFTYVRDVLYDEAGRMTHLELGDTGSEAVIQRNYSYYPWDQSVQGGRMSSLTGSSIYASKTSLQSLAYTYDAAGNLTQISDEQADETATFSYDGLDRLTGMSVLNDLSETVHSEVFTYDEAGRMSAKGPDAQSLSAFSYDPQHPHAVNGLGSNTYSYDNNGNQVTRNLADLQYELSYDAENHLVDVDSSLAPSPTPTATPTTTPTATLYSIYLPMVMVVPNNATPTPTATANPATPAATATPTPEITPTATSVIAYPMLPQEEPQTPAGRQPQQTPKPAPQATPAPETANPSARGANTHPLQLPPNRPALAQDPTQEPSPTPTATPETVQANYLYDGDGNLARGIVNGVVTFYPGRHYNREVDGANVTVKKFYTLGSSTVAVRTVQGSNDTLNWILGDHLGSASVTANADGSLNSELRYTAFGEVRYNNGLTPTDYRYTGQLEQASINLYWYRSRWFDGELAHFVQADSLIPDPGDPLAWDRYAYVENNSLNYTDPSGHDAWWCHGAACQAEHYAKLGYGNLSSVYKIKFTGKWADEQKNEILTGFSRIVRRIDDLTYKHGVDGIDSFIETFDEIEYYMDQSGDEPYCTRLSSGSGVGCFGGYTNRRNVAHELGHVFSANENNYANETFGIIGIYDKNGNWVTGIHNENGIWERGFLGYKDDEYPWVHHGNDWGDWTTYTPDEEFADMFMNWAWESFDKYRNPEAGNARMDWMNANLVEIFTGK
ncbi:RHS repeat-associated core domain-containing protein [Ornatilinea apprima]|nr:RHS repeat-associated core domain-containing protein [Ornatilinea apprima]